jgi:hypothetical protein
LGHGDTAAVPPVQSGVMTYVPTRAYVASGPTIPTAALEVHAAVVAEVHRLLDDWFEKRIAGRR